MADNVPITSGAGLTVASDEDGGGLQHQWVKIKFGADGSFTSVDTANGFPVQILSLPDLGLNSSVKITSLPDLGLGSVVKITSLPDLGLGSSVKVSSLPQFAVGAITSISNLSFTISNLSTVPLTVSGTTIAITSLPDLGLNSVVKITSLPDLGLNSSVKITSLPALGFGGLVSISNLAITISNLSTIPITVSGTTIAITSLPALGFGGLVSCSNGQIVSISNLSITISNLSTVPLTISGTTIAITSLPNLGLGSILSINNLTVNTGISTSFGSFPVQNVAQRTYWSFTATQASAGTILIKAETGSQTAIYITNIIISNENTAGNASLIESNRGIAIRPVVERLYFAVNGGMVGCLATPLVCDTNTSLYLLTRTVTNLSITASGFTGLQPKLT
jgi:hypothetical protein